MDEYPAMDIILFRVDGHLYVTRPSLCKGVNELVAELKSLAVKWSETS